MEDGRGQTQFPRKDSLATPLGAAVLAAEKPVVPQRLLSFSCFSRGQVGHMRLDCPRRSLVNVGNSNWTMTSLYRLKGGSSRMCDFGLIPCVPQNGL